MGDTTRIIILAEGGDSRLRPLTEHLPTSLLPVGGTPILDRQIQTLLQMGLTRIHVVGGYRAVQVRQLCRFYDSVRFVENPRFDRTEPRVSSLGVVDPTPGPMLLVRGDLLFQERLVRRALESSGGNLRVLGDDDREIGIVRCTSGISQKLFSIGAETRADDPRLFPYVASLQEVEGVRSQRAEAGSWQRVRSLEDLARALRTHPARGEAMAA